MSRKSKVKNTDKLIGIVGTLLERQERLLKHINDLEEYVEILENMSDFEGDENLIIQFTPDEEFEDILDNGLTDEQKSKLKELKKTKEKEQPLHSMDDILKIFEDEKSNE